MIIELKVLGNENQLPSHLRPVVLTTTFELSAMSEFEAVTIVVEAAKQLLGREAGAVWARERAAEEVAKAGAVAAAG